MTSTAPTKIILTDIDEHEHIYTPDSEHTPNSSNTRERNNREEC